MNSLIKLIINYQKTNSNETFKEIVKSFEGLIKHKIKTIPAYYKDDIYQEMLMELFNCIKQFKINLTANIDQTLFNIEIYNCLKNNDFKNVNSKLQNKYIRLFIKKYGTKLLEKAFTCKYHQDLFVKEFCYFTNQNQFIKSLNKRFLFVYLNFLKKHQKDLNKSIKSLNEFDEDKNEIIDNLIDPKTIKEDKNYFCYDLTKEEMEFIWLFLRSVGVATEKEVANKLKISQQAVHKKKSKIIKKYKKI